jgi:hypothetical protein
MIKDILDALHKHPEADGYFIRIAKGQNERIETSKQAKQRIKWLLKKL